MSHLKVFDNKKNQFFYCGVVNDRLYCSLFSDGSIVELDHNTGRMRQLNTVVMCEPDCWKDGGMDYLYFNNMVYIVENRRRKIARYDIKNDECSFFDISGQWYTSLISNYTLATIFADKIYIFPRFDKEIIIFSLTDNCMKNSLYFPFDGVSIPSSDMLAEDPVSAAIFSNAKRLEENVFLTCDALKKIVVFNFRDRCILYKDYPMGLEQCVDFIIKDDILYFLSFYGDVYCYNMTRGEWNSLSVHGDKLEFGRLLVTDSNICLLPCQGNDIVIYDIAGKEFYRYDEYPEDFVYALRYPGMAKFFGRCEDDEWYYMAMCAQNYMLKVSKHTGQLAWIKPQGISSKEKTRFYIKKGVSVINESAEYGILGFLQYNRNMQQGNMKLCGRFVHKFFVEE